MDLLENRRWPRCPVKPSTSAQRSVVISPTSGRCLTSARRKSSAVWTRAWPGCDYRPSILSKYCVQLCIHQLSFHWLIDLSVDSWLGIRSKLGAHFERNTSGPGKNSKLGQGAFYRHHRISRQQITVIERNQRFLLSHNVSFCLILSHIVTCCLILSHIVTCCHILSHFVTFCLILSHFVTFCHTMSHDVWFLILNSFENVLWCQTMSKL